MVTSLGGQNDLFCFMGQVNHCLQTLHCLLPGTFDIHPCTQISQRFSKTQGLVCSFITTPSIRPTCISSIYCGIIALTSVSSATAGICRLLLRLLNKMIDSFEEVIYRQPCLVQRLKPR